MADGAAGATRADRVRHAEPVMGTVVSFDVPRTARDDGSLAAAVSWLLTLRRPAMVARQHLE